MKRYSILFFLILLGLSITGCKKNEKVEPEIKTNHTVENKESSDLAPNFDLTSTEGKAIKLSDYRGKVVIVDFWATWCPPCRKGIPELIELQNEFKNNLVIIGISLDQNTESDVVPFIKKYGINDPVVFGTNQVMMDYGAINAIPTSFVINKDGKIVDKHVGLVPKSVYEKKIKEILS